MKKILFFLILLLSGCSKNDFTPIGQSFETQMDNQKITLTFHTNGQFSGQVIDEYFGQYKINGNEIELTLQGSTMKLAPTPQLEAENRYFKTLKEIHHFENDKNYLILKGNNFNYNFHLLNSDEVNIH